MEVVRYMYFSILMSFSVLGCSESLTENKSDLNHGFALPPIGQVGGPAYQTDEERSETAKADALKVLEGFQELYGPTAPPPIGVNLLPEWAPHDAILIAWYEPLEPYMDDLVTTISALTPVWIISPNIDTSDALRTRWEVLGVDPESIRFFEYEHEAFWTRDYGPWSLVAEDGTLHYLDPQYYPTRYRDDAVPTLLGANFLIDVYRPKFSAEGGNIMNNGAGLCVTTTRLIYNNPPLKSFEMADQLKAWLGCDRTIFLEPLKGERTGHVDLIAKFVSPDSIILGRYDPADDPENAARLERNAERLSNIRLADGRPLKISRILLPSARDKVFRSYTNALQIGQDLLMPIYPDWPELNEAARMTFEEHMTDGGQVYEISAENVNHFGGAIHCTTMQLRVNPHILRPNMRDQPRPFEFPLGAFGKVSNQTWSRGRTLTDQLVIRFEDTSGIQRVPTALQVGVWIEHRTPSDVKVFLSHNDTESEIPSTNQVQPINGRVISLIDFEGHSIEGTWTLNISSPRSTFNGALLHWWIRPTFESP